MIIKIEIPNLTPESTLTEITDGIKDVMSSVKIEDYGLWTVA